MSRCLLTACLLLGGLSACSEPVTPCEEYDRFAEAVAESCPALAWDCEAEYSALGPERQQDLDWCLDCVRGRMEGETDLDCSEAPLSTQDCSGLLEATLDATGCFR